MGLKITSCDDLDRLVIDYQKRLGFGSVRLFVCLSVILSFRRSVSRITYKVMNGFAQNFYQRSVACQRTIRKIFGMMRIRTGSKNRLSGVGSGL